MGAIAKDEPRLQLRYWGLPSFRPHARSSSRWGAFVRTSPLCHQYLACFRTPLPAGPRRRSMRTCSWAVPDASGVNQSTFESACSWGDGSVTLGCRLGQNGQPIVLKAENRHAGSRSKSLLSGSKRLSRSALRAELGRMGPYGEPRHAFRVGQRNPRPSWLELLFCRFAFEFVVLALASYL
jgi:hypothetical protein